MENEELFVVRVILFICILLTLGTVVGVFCILYRRRPRRIPIKREDASVLRDEIQTPKLSKEDEYIESQDNFVEIVEDSDNVH